MGLSYPLWVSLRIQTDFVNPGIWSAFLCIHRCPLLHTGGIYPHDLQNTRIATTSNDELGQKEDKIEPPVMEEGHQGVHVHFHLVGKGAPLLFRCDCQVWDTVQVRCQALAEISLSAIGKLENRPKYPVAIHRTIVEKRCCDPRCHPTLTWTMLATICEPSMFLKHPMKCISPQESSVVLALSQFNWDQWGWHFPLVSEQVVFHWLFSILTTFLLSTALQSVSSGALHWIEHLHHLSGSHVSNSWQRNTLHLHHAVPSQYHLRDHQAHVKTAASSDNTSYRVNGIPV